jgi:hypothetical protein
MIGFAKTLLLLLPMLWAAIAIADDAGVRDFGAPIALETPDVRRLLLLLQLPEGLVGTRFAKLCQVTGAQNAHRAPHPHLAQFPKP